MSEDSTFRFNNKYIKKLMYYFFSISHDELLNNVYSELIRILRQDFNVGNDDTNQ